MHLALSQRNLSDGSNPTFCAGRKIGIVEKALRWNLLQGDPACPSRVLLAKVAQTQELIPVSVRQLHRLRVTWQLNRCTGRPRQTPCRPPGASGAPLAQVTPRLSCVGVHLLAHWLDQQDGFAPIVARLQHAIEASKNRHPDEDLAVLQHRKQTLRRRLQALFFAPL
jgi:hypothetical protein